MEARLHTQLAPLAKMLRDARLYRALALCWAAAALLGLGVLGLTGQTRRTVATLPVIAGVIMAAIAWLRHKGKTDDLTRALEPHQPELQHLLAAAAEQRPAQDSGAFSFLQLRVIEHVLMHPRQGAWRRQLERHLAMAQLAHVGALLALIAVVFALNQRASPGASATGSLAEKEITVTPGDAQVERGTGLVIAARFGGTPPAEATVVLNSPTGKESRFPMARRLADPVFGASVPEISEAGFYHVEYRGRKTRDYKITVFEFPALVRADATLRYPAYTGLTNRTIRDTLRVSAVEGSRLSYALQLNKPVARARWAGQKQSIALVTHSNAVAILPEFLLTNSGRYSLELVDAEGRSNKFPTDFVLQALTNQRPEVKLVFPRRDVRVSRLQELPLQAEASDDFGLLKYGIGFGVAGGTPQLIELGKAAPANTKRQFDYLISLETLGVEVNQSVTYFAWADDYGPDGQTRRTFSDMFFADVRPFDEVFRQDESGSAESGGQGGGNERVKLAELQKQIVVATWNLQREKTGASTAQNP